MRLPLSLMAAAGGIATLAACAPPPPPPTVIVTPAAPAACTADDYARFVGQKSPAITVPAGVEVRHYRTGDPVTMDYKSTRLNFEYDRAGRLVRVSCG